MRLTAAFVSHEWRTQWRSLRFRAFAALYLAAGVAPAVLIHILAPRSGYTFGEATYAMETTTVLPLLTAVFALLLSLDGITREQSDGAWTTVTLCQVSSAGYLLRRWIAILAVILPLTAIPLLAAAAITAMDGVTGLTVETWLAPWLFQVLPVAVTVSAFALGAGTIGGGPLASLPLIAAVLALVPALAGEALHRFRLVIDPPLQGLRLQFVTYAIARAVKAARGDRSWGFGYPMPGSEGGIDLRRMAVQQLVAAAPLAILAAAALGLAVLYLRRTRPDVRPRPIRSDHPFRSFILTWNRLRERYKPDPAPALADRAALVAGLLAASLLAGLLVSRAYGYEALAAVRYAVETGGSSVPRIDPMSAQVVPGLWRVRGEIGPGSRVSFEVSGEMINRGPRPAGHLAFLLDPSLELAAAADSGTVTATRTWDRLALELAPPIPAGGRRELRFRLSGEPARTVFPEGRPGIFARPTFKGGYEQHRDAEFSRDRINFARSFRERSISGRKVDLSRGALVPVPAYAWPREDDETAESISPQAKVELSLSGPAGVFLADSCGGIAVPDGAGARPAGTRLESSCATSLSDLSVVGGRQRLLDERSANEGGAVAAFPAHRRLAGLHLGFLERSADMLKAAWPGIGMSSGRLVVVEWPTDGDAAYWRYHSPGQSFVTVRGNLVFLQESELIWLGEIRPERMVAEILAVRLANRRRVDPGQSLFFQQLFRNVALERLGLGPENGAMVGPVPPSQYETIRASALRQEPWSPYWDSRFPSLISALKSRMGEEPLRAAVEELLARGDDPGAGAGTAAELFALFEKHSPEPVGRMIQEYFLDGKLPYPVLADVRFRRSGDTWRVTGRMVNEGQGEALCKVVLTTDLGPESTVARADGGQAAGFELATRHRPQGVFLDPGHECHRLVESGGARDRVYFEGESR